MKTILSILLLAALPILGTACTSTGDLAPGVATATTIGTSLAVNAYPGAAPFVSMAANAIRAYTAHGAPSAAHLATDLTPYATAAESLAGNVSSKAKADVTRFFDAVVSRYTAALPKIQAGEMTVEQFAAAVEAGA